MAVRAIDAQLEALIEKYRPKQPDDPASSGVLWHLNKAGLLEAAITREAETQGWQGSGEPGWLSGLVVTKQTAWEVMADAQRNGVTF